MALSFCPPSISTVLKPSWQFCSRPALGPLTCCCSKLHQWKAASDLFFVPMFSLLKGVWTNKQVKKTGSEMSEKLLIHQHRPGNKDVQSMDLRQTQNMRSKPTKCGEPIRNAELYSSVQLGSYSNRPNSGSNQLRLPWFPKPIFLRQHLQALSTNMAA